MAKRKRLDDKAKKRIVADYVTCQNYSEVARKHGISANGVKKIVQGDAESAEKFGQKQNENTEDTLAYMQAQHETKKRIAGKLLNAIEKKAETVDMFTGVKDLATAYGILVDKELKFAEIKSANGEEKAAYAGLPARVMGREWVDINRDVDERGHSQYDLKGGRGSLKSSYCGMKLVDLVMLNPTFCGLAVRQLKDNLKDSVYAQIVWAIDELGLTHEFHCLKSPLEIRRKSTGQIIYFRGADDPGKIKSIKPPNGMHIGVVWVEEADQLRGPDALRNIVQSAFRGGDEGILFRSYNTPISQQHFINAEEREEKPNRLLHHSHFKNAPPNWLGKRFYEEAEILQKLNPRAYRHEYDGEATGTGANVFENIVERAITDEEIKSFDRILNGVDWGYYPDPWAFERMQYHAGSRTLYIFDEAVANRKGNRETAQIIKDHGVTAKDRITCDSAEPKSVADYREYGLSGAQGAEKGPGSVEYSFKWLASLAAIVIDKHRCPRAYEEFLSYEHERDKDGHVLSGYPDKDNHCIDAVRYATEDIWKQRTRYGFVK